MINNQSIKVLKDYICNAYSNILKKIDKNIYRGHLRSLSTDIEDGIALFISSILPDYKIFIDSSIHVDCKNNRPDILIIDKNNNVVAMCEIKANMGWCRDAKGIINNIISNNLKFVNEKKLFCEFSNDAKQEVTYLDNVKLFLISLTDSNCSAKKHILNKTYADANNVYFYNLFSGWYNNLVDKEVDEFVNELLELDNRKE